jgi:hypothetical protein
MVITGDHTFATHIDAGLLTVSRRSTMCDLSNIVAVVLSSRTAPVAARLVLKDILPLLITRSLHIFDERVQRVASASAERQTS